MHPTRSANFCFHCWSNVTAVDLKFPIVMLGCARHPDSVTEHFRALSDHGGENIIGASDEHVAEFDSTRWGSTFLVDVAMHTANNRLLVFARKPAPVQVTYLQLTALDDGDGHDRLSIDRSLPGSAECWRPVLLRAHSFRLPENILVLCARPRDAGYVGPPPAALPVGR